MNIFEPVVWVCGQTRCFNDDVEIRCNDCHVTVYHRPHAVPSAVKLCLSCSEIRRGLEKHKGAIMMTRECIADAERFFQ